MDENRGKILFPLAAEMYSFITAENINSRNKLIEPVSALSLVLQLTGHAALPEIDPVEYASICGEVVSEIDFADVESDYHPRLMEIIRAIYKGDLFMQGKCVSFPDKRCWEVSDFCFGTSPDLVDIFLHFSVKKEGHIINSINSALSSAVSTIAHKIELSQNLVGLHTAYCLATDGHVLGVAKVTVDALTVDNDLPQILAVGSNSAQQSMALEPLDAAGPQPEGIKALHAILAMITARNLAAFGHGPLRPNGVVNGYTLTKVLGRGAFSTVFRAHPAGSGADFVIKKVHQIPRLHGINRPLEKQLSVINAERNTLQQLSSAAVKSPNIPTLSQHQPFLMFGGPMWIGLADEYIDMQTYFRSLPVDDRLPFTIGSFLTGMCEAVVFSHRKGVSHNNLLPENIGVCVKNGVAHHQAFPVILGWGHASLLGVPIYHSRKGMDFFHDQIVRTKQAATVVTTIDHDRASVRYLLSSLQTFDFAHKGCYNVLWPGAYMEGNEHMITTRENAITSSQAIVDTAFTQAWLRATA